MPITPRNTTDAKGGYGLAEVFYAKTSGDVCYTSFKYLLAAIHINGTTAAIVGVASDDGADTALTTASIANAGTLIVFGRGEGGAAVTLG